MTGKTETNDYWKVFQDFQTKFYTSVPAFSLYTNFEIKENSVMLLINMAKGYPHRALQILDIYSPEVKAVNSPEILFALQKQFVNNFSKQRLPQYIYFKGKKKATVKKETIKKNKSKQIKEFQPEIVFEIQSRMFLDSKSYQQLKHTKEVQDLGIRLTDEYHKELFSKI